MPNKIKTVVFEETEIFFNDNVGILLTSKIEIKTVKYGVNVRKLKPRFKSASSNIKGININMPPAGDGTPSK